MTITYSCQKFISIFFCSLFIISCNNKNNDTNEQSKNLHVKIGTQIWATQNLDVTAFRNGDGIPEARTDEEWKKAEKEKKPAWCYYNNDSENGKKYGKLYNWYAVSDYRGIAPKGYHVPSLAEWEILVSNLGGRTTTDGTVSDIAGKKLKSKTG